MMTFLKEDMRKSHFFLKLNSKFMYQASVKTAGKQRDSAQPELALEDRYYIQPGRCVTWTLIRLSPH